MEIIITKNDNNICVNNGQSDIEKYNLESEINFSKLVNFLLALNLREKITLIDSIDDKNEAEDNLVKLIELVINDYNDKVEEYHSFIVQHNNE